MELRRRVELRLGLVTEGPEMGQRPWLCELDEALLEVKPTFQPLPATAHGASMG